MIEHTQTTQRYQKGDRVEHIRTPGVVWVIERAIQFEGMLIYELRNGSHCWFGIREQDLRPAEKVTT